jgi:hypothetical protein
MVKEWEEAQNKAKEKKAATKQEQEWLSKIN